MLFHEEATGEMLEAKGPKPVNIFKALFKKF